MDDAATLALKDIHLPGANSWFPELIRWWPPAIGWWLLLILVIFIIWILKRLTRKTAIKSAKAILVAIQLNKAMSTSQKLAELCVLIRRVAMHVSPRQQVASLTGAAWLAYLDNSVKHAPFSTGIGQYLGDAHYQPSQISDAELGQLFGLCETWLKAQNKHI
ncbi:MAG: DUF4381 domain-containing protein [Methylococcaceae bacterium]|jgi:hypothetical protein